MIDSFPARPLRQLQCGLLFLLMVTLVAGADRLSCAFPDLPSSNPGNSAFAKDSISPNQLIMCRDDIIGVKFLCNPNWDMEAFDDRILIVISSAPHITFTIKKRAAPFRYLMQYNKSEFEKTGLYADGFSTELTEIDGIKAFKVKSYGKEERNSRLLDYYVIIDGALYTLSFHLGSKDSWDKNQFLFQTITKSFLFIDNRYQTAEDSRR